MRKVPAGGRVLPARPLRAGNKKGRPAGAGRPSGSRIRACRVGGRGGLPDNHTVNPVLHSLLCKLGRRLPNWVACVNLWPHGGGRRVARGRRRNARKTRCGKCAKCLAPQVFLARRFRKVSPRAPAQVCARSNAAFTKRDTCPPKAVLPAPQACVSHRDSIGRQAPSGERFAGPVRRIARRPAFGRKRPQVVEPGAGSRARERHAGAFRAPA